MIIYFLLLAFNSFCFLILTLYVNQKINIATRIEGIATEIDKITQNVASADWGFIVATTSICITLVISDNLLPSGVVDLVWALILNW